MQDDTDNKLRRSSLIKIIELGSEDHAIALGYFVIAWAQLESEIDILIRLIADDINDDVTRILLGQMDIADKLKALHALGFIRHPNDEWWKYLNDFIDAVNDLKGIRNKLMHNDWFFTSKGVGLRTERKSKVSKPKSPDKSLAITEIKPISAEEIAGYVRSARLLMGAAITLQCLGADGTKYPMKAVESPK